MIDKHRERGVPDIPRAIARSQELRMQLAHSVRMGKEQSMRFRRATLDDWIAFERLVARSLERISRSLDASDVDTTERRIVLRMRSVAMESMKDAKA